MKSRKLLGEPRFRGSSAEIQANSNVRFCRIAHSIASAIGSRTCSARSKTGDASTPPQPSNDASHHRSFSAATPATTDAPTPSCPPSASLPPSSSGFDQLVLSLANYRAMSALHFVWILAWSHAPIIALGKSWWAAILEADTPSSLTSVARRT